jgi:hypothetical protein
VDPPGVKEILEDASADEEEADISRSLALIARDGGLGAPALAARQVLRAPAVWVRRGLGIGAFLTLPWIGATLRALLVAPPDPHGSMTFLATLLTCTLVLAGLVPVAGAAAFRAFADGRRPEWRDWGHVVDALPAYALHLGAAYLLGQLALTGSLVATPLGVLLVFSWLVTAGEIGAMRRGWGTGMLRGPTRAVGYLLRLPRRLTDATAPRPRLGTTMFLWAGTVLGAAMLGAVLANGILWIQGLAPLAVGTPLELLAMWLYATCLALALDAGAGLWTYRYLAHQAAVGALAPSGTTAPTLPGEAAGSPAPEDDDDSQPVEGDPP